MHRWQLTGINEVLSSLAISTRASNGDSDQACRRVGTRILKFHEDARTSMEHVAETRILTSSEWQHSRALMSLRNEINVTVTWLFFKAWTYTHKINHETQIWQFLRYGVPEVPGHEILRVLRVRERVTKKLPAGYPCPLHWHRSPLRAMFRQKGSLCVCFGSSGRF